MEILNVNGDFPQARFGHTLTYLGQNKAVLFGGAVGDAGKYTITSDTFVFDCSTSKWKKLSPSGTTPTPRAAHATACVESLQMVIYGGATGGGGLTSEDLILLDLRDGDEKAKWVSIPVTGPTPGRRYGHTLAYAKPYLIVFAGNTGSEAVNDVWVLDVEKPPYVWNRVTLSDGPPARVYHSSAICNSGSASGMMVTFGGRTAEGAAAMDTWGLRKHRNGKWDWVKAPSKPNETPTARFQHTSVFVNSLMFVLGGRTNALTDSVALEVYNTETSEWTKFPSIKRFRHGSWALENSQLFIYGGFEPENPNVPTGSFNMLDIYKLLQTNQKLMKYLPVKDSKVPAKNEPNQGSSGKIEVENPKPRTPIPLKEKRIRMMDPIVTTNADDDRDRIFKKVALHQLMDESKKLAAEHQNENHEFSEDVTTLLDIFLPGLMCPHDSANKPQFAFKREEVAYLCSEVIRVLSNEPVVLRLRYPIKIFGSLYGQYQDMMRLFSAFGAPNDTLNCGDIDKFDYLFLGNFVDRGCYSLEVICLLFALKLKHPEQIHLIRGAHEDPKVNQINGLAEECAQKLGENPNDPNSIFNMLNRAFSYLSLAAVIEDKALCVSCGVGNTTFALDEIDALSKPIQIAENPGTRIQKIVRDLLWAPPDNEEVVNQFLTYNQLPMLIRSKECVVEGIDESPNSLVVTIFSATNYGGKHANNGGVLYFKKNSELTSKTITSINAGSEGNWIDEKKSGGRPATPPKKK